MKDLEAKLAALKMDVADPLFDPTLAAYPGAAVRALSLAVQLGCKRVAARIVQVVSLPAPVAIAGGFTALHMAASMAGETDSACNPEVVRLLLKAAPGAADVAAEDGTVPLHHAAAAGCPEVVQLLLQAAPGTLTAPGIRGCIPLHYAATPCAQPGCSSPINAIVVEQLLKAAPHTAAAVDQRGCSTLHLAASALAEAHAAAAVKVVRLLLAAAPEMAAAPLQNGSTPLLLAAAALNYNPAEALQALQLMLEVAPPAAALARAHGTTALLCALYAQAAPAGRPSQGAEAATAVQLLLSAAPELATVTGEEGFTPLMAAASLGQSKNAQLLLEAAPQNAVAVDGRGRTALSYAVQSGNARTVSLLLAAAPQAAVLVDSSGRTPLEWAAPDQIHSFQIEQLLIAEQLQRAETGQDVRRILTTLHKIWERLHVETDMWGQMSVGMLFASVASRHALTAADWELVPPSCASLAAALPDVLLRSEEEAGMLVARLPNTRQACLRAAALCLARVADGRLPAANRRMIMGLCCSFEPARREPFFIDDDDDFDLEGELWFPMIFNSLLISVWCM